MNRGIYEIGDDRSTPAGGTPFSRASGSCRGGDPCPDPTSDPRVRTVPSRGTRTRRLLLLHRSGPGRQHQCITSELIGRSLLSKENTHVLLLGVFGFVQLSDTPNKQQPFVSPTTSYCDLCFLRNGTAHTVLQLGTCPQWRNLLRSSRKS